jgi:tRNA(Arg) A34 adenosine deaminase TadA
VTAPGHAGTGPAGPAPEDLPHLRRCVELAAEAVEAGDFPFGSVLVAGDGRVLAEDRNRENSAGDATRHPEIELSRWAAANMTAGQRAAATVFTSGEHCPMCSAAHAWVGLGRIVYVSSSEQLITWLGELGVSPSPVVPLAVNQVAPGLVVQGPMPGLDEQVRELHRRFRAGRT